MIRYFLSLSDDSFRQPPITLTNMGTTKNTADASRIARASIDLFALMLITAPNPDAEDPPDDAERQS